MEGKEEKGGRGEGRRGKGGGESRTPSKIPSYGLVLYSDMKRRIVGSDYNCGSHSVACFKGAATAAWTPPGGRTIDACASTNFPSRM